MARRRADDNDPRCMSCGRRTRRRFKCYDPPGWTYVFNGVEYDEPRPWPLCSVACARDQVRRSDGRVPGGAKVVEVKGAEPEAAPRPAPPRAPAARAVETATKIPTPNTQAPSLDTLAAALAALEEL